MSVTATHSPSRTGRRTKPFGLLSLIRLATMVPPVARMASAIALEASEAVSSAASGER